MPLVWFDELCHNFHFWVNYPFKNQFRIFRLKKSFVLTHKSAQGDIIRHELKEQCVCVCVLSPSE